MKAESPHATGWRRWWLYGVGGGLGALVLALVTLIAVASSLWFVVTYAKVGPIPGQKVLRPVDDLGGLVRGPGSPPPAH